MDGLRRDRTTRVAYAHLAVFGFAVYAFSPCVPLVRDELDLSRAVAGLHGTLLAVGVVLSSLASTAIVRDRGRRVALSGGLVVVNAGLVLFAAGHALPLTLAGAFVVGFGMTLCSNAVTTVLSDVHGRRAGAALAESNALAAGVGIVAPLVVGGAEAAGIGWRVGVLLMVPATIAVLLAARGTPIPQPAEYALEAHERPVGRLPVAYWITWSAAVCCIAVEFSLTTWGSELLRTRTGLDAGFATASVTLLVAGLAVGRWYGTRLTLRRPHHTLLIGALSLNGIGFALLWVATSPAPALAGLFVCGLGLALQFPLVLARAIAAAPGRTDLAVARISIGSGIAIGCAPFALGALADGIGTHAASLLVPLLLVSAGVALTSSRRYERSPIPT